MGRGFALGVAVAVLSFVAAAYVAVSLGLVQAAADHKPGRLERWAALHALSTSIRRASQGLESPLSETDAELAAGAKIYAQDCLVCHGAADGKASSIARGLHITAPQLAVDGVEDDPEGRTYWKVKHGIRFTGMPAFGGALTDEQIWLVTSFVSRMDHLPPAVANMWKGMPSAATPRP